MINLITGTPGSGKTTYSLKFMLDQLMGSKRKIYVHGISDLKIPHEVVYCTSRNCDVCNKKDVLNMHPSLLAENWHTYAPDGAVYFFDEVQNIYRPRNSGKNVPDSVQAFEVHRHRGLDFFLITQSPKLIDVNIRAMVSRHIHLKSTWLKRVQFEWPECKDSVQSVTDAIKSGYKLDKKFFKLFHSASVHTKQKRKVPAIVYTLAIVFVLVSGLSYRVYAKINDKIDPVSKKEQSTLKHLMSSGAGEATQGAAQAPPAKYSYQELLTLSYSDENLVSSRLPKICSRHTKLSYRCFIKRSISTKFKSSYCMDDICYFILSFGKKSENEYSQTF